ncbi:MAG: redoxin domain-containing protein [Candidatus Saccharicenans sp.]
MKKTKIALIFLMLICSSWLSWSAQEQPSIKIALLGQPMPDFSLPAYQGGEFKLSQLKGKTVMLIFPRGYAAPDRWCTICDYKYVELVELEKSHSLRKKYNLEIAFVFPYSKEVVKKWLEDLPAQIDKIKSWKYPENYASLDEKGRQSVQRYRQLFPKDLSLKPGEVPTPFPILIDSEHLVSSGLGLFTTNWNGSQVEQNIPAVYLIDARGILRFKYVSQNTVDRPEYDYLFKIIEFIKAGKL